MSEPSPSPESPAGAPPRGRAAWGWAALILAATLCAYWPSLRGGMIWNDADYVTAPGLRSLHGLGLIWFKLGATQQYYPFLHSAFWVEHRLWGDSTLGYHLTNVGLHALASCLFALVLLRLIRRDGAQPAGWPWLAGLIFALHPVCVESVAWISEQKNTLSLVFYLLAALAYLRWSAQRSDRAGYFLATFLFILALLSKSVTATLPAALLVVIWWRRGRLEWRKDAAPLLPWFALAAVSGLFSAWVERTYIGAKGSAFDLGLGQRCLLAGRIVWFYLGKLLWPRDLIFIYPRWTIDPRQAWQWLFLLGTAAAALLLWLWRGRSRAPLAAFLFFVGSLFPVLGFFNVYAFVFSFVADHWQYLPCLGVIALAAGGWGRLFAFSRGAQRWLLQALAAVLLLVLGSLTWRQSRMYYDIRTFYETTLRQNPDCWMAHNNLGNLLHGHGEELAAMAHFQAALRLKPDLAETHNNYGSVLRSLGRSRDALEQFRLAVKYNPDMADAHAGLGFTLAEAGQTDAAVKEFQTSLRLAPFLAGTHNSFGIILAQLGRNAEAEAQIRETLRLDPNYPGAYSNLANVLCQEGRQAEAIAWYQKAIQLEPANVDVRDDLAMTLGQLGRLPEAIAELQEALRRNPRSAQTHFDLYISLMSAGRPDEALDHFHAARQLDPTVGQQ